VKLFISFLLLPFSKLSFFPSGAISDNIIRRNYGKTERGKRKKEDK
jgi:hypothetical protein